jgi:uncharacterized protein (DUF952 family)
MGFTAEFNSIIRSDDYPTLQKGASYPFTKTGSRIMFDNIPIWLTKNDWTALAEIRVTTQTRTPQQVSGQFLVEHIYDPAEQAGLTAMFRRMYANGSDPFIYLLISGADHAAAVARGTLYDASLQTSGFIHASPIDQLTRIANKYYRTVADVKVMVAEVLKIDAIVRWEPATDGIYPHIYGPLNMDAVTKVVPVSPAADGTYHIQPSDLAK